MSEFEDRHGNILHGSARRYAYTMDGMTSKQLRKQERAERYPGPTCPVCNTNPVPEADETCEDCEGLEVCVGCGETFEEGALKPDRDGDRCCEPCVKEVEAQFQEQRAEKARRGEADAYGGSAAHCTVCVDICSYSDLDSDGKCFQCKGRVQCPCCDEPVLESSMVRDKEGELVCKPCLETLKTQDQA